MNNHRAFPACALLLAWALSLSGVAFADPPATSPDAKAAWYNLLPNGSFEHWSHFGAEVLARQLKAGTVYDSDDPLVPTCWNFETSSGTSLKRSQDAHSGKHAISIGAGKNGWARLGLGRLEVIPGAEYTFGVWVKGTGKVSVSLQGQAFEGNQELGALNAQAGDKYALVEGKAVIPRHIRFVALELVAWGDMLLDDAHISARLDQPYDADAVLAKKYARDSHTLVMADFEKDDPGIILETKAHVIKEGKFGKALRIDPPDTASIPFKVEKMPQEGTFEFWLSPDEIPIFQPNRKDTIKTYLVVRSGAADLAHISSDTSGCLRWSWRTGEDTWHWQNSVAANCLGRMRKGQWTHVAVTWDKEAWRMYVDGVLADVQTDPPLNWFAAPVNIGISVDYAHGQWKGAIAEIRVSDIKRYGPIVPTGATVPPMIKAAPAVVVEPPKPAKPKTDFAPERAKLIGTLPPTGAGAEDKPDPSGDYVYEAASLKPLVTGSCLDLHKDKPAPGLTTATTGQGQSYNGWINCGGAYWKLGPIQQGKYWVGVWYQSNNIYWPDLEAPVEGNGPLNIYLNGRTVQNSTTSDPVQVAPGIWYAEVQSALAEPLKPGDEITVTPKRCATTNLPAPRAPFGRASPRRGQVSAELRGPVLAQLHGADSDGGDLLRRQEDGPSAPGQPCPDDRQSRRPGSR